MKPQWNDPERLESETYVGDQDDSLAAVLDELSDKVLSGEDFDLEAYCLQYPSYAERIRDLVPTLRAMQTFAEAPSESAGTSFDCCRMRIGDSQHPFGQFGVVDVRTGKFTELYQGTQGCFSIAISPTNPDLAAIATERTKDAWGIDLWDVRRGELVGHVGNEGDMPYDLAFSPDGEFLAASRLSSKKQDVGKQHSAVSIWQVADGSLAHEIVCSGSTDADFSPDGQFLAFCDLPDSECHVIDLRSEQRQKLTFTCKQAYQVKFIRNGTQVVCVGLNAELVVWDIANQQVTFKAQPADRLAVSLAVAPGDQTVAVGFEDCTVGLWHTATWTSMGSLSTPNLPLNLEFSPDGTKLVAGCLDGSIVVWDTDGRKQVFRDQLDAKD